MGTSSVILFLGAITYLVVKLRAKSKWKEPKKEFNKEWRRILIEKVNFYHALSREDKVLFEFKVQEFLLNCRVVGIRTSVDDTDKVLVAASAVIPIFKFPKWRYTNVFEVLIYPDSFNRKFQTVGPNRNIRGMVGEGFMQGKMILSKKALHKGFSNETDKRNTAIHEFVHLIDMADGSVDGVPELLLEKQYTIPWLELLREKMDDIYEKRSDINPYGGTHQREFFAVVSEYFFERPKLLERKHPELYKILEEIFDHDMTSVDLDKERFELGRNEDCICGSGEKYKNCCGK